MNKLLLFAFVAVAVFTTAYGDRISVPLQCNRPNEEYQCGSACQTTCATLGQPCPVVNIRCNDECYCIDGYARRGGNSATCIPISDCPSSNQSSDSSDSLDSR